MIDRSLKSAAVKSACFYGVVAWVLTVLMVYDVTSSQRIEWAYGYMAAFILAGLPAFVAMDALWAVAAYLKRRASHDRT